MMNQKKLYLVPICGNTVLSKLIRWIRQENYKHEAIVSGENLNTMYDFNSCHVNNSFIKCFSNEKFNEVLHTNFYEIPSSITETPILFYSLFWLRVNRSTRCWHLTSPLLHKLELSEVI